MEKGVNFMSNVERCLQQKTGSCAGCEVLGIVLKRRLSVPRKQEKTITAGVSRSLCPEGTTMQVPARPEQPVW